MMESLKHFFHSHTVLTLLFKMARVNIFRSKVRTIKFDLTRSSYFYAQSVSKSQGCCKSRTGKSTFQILSLFLKFFSETIINNKFPL